MPTRRHHLRRFAAAAVAAVAAATAVSACGGVAGDPGNRILAVGAESQYANVIAQVGGRAVSVTAVMDNPNTDPHSFEASPSIANAISTAELVVQNGLGYDSFMNRVEAAAPNGRRHVIDVARLLGMPASAPNPHLWYDPRTMPAVAHAVAADLAALRPREAAIFRANAARFIRSLRPWSAALAALRSRSHGAAVATTEPVANFLLRAAGIANASPFSFQADVMNGVDPAPQSVSLVEGLLSQRRVRALVVNRQVTDSLTDTLRGLARAHGVPVVGVDETMPRRLDYQHWMLQTTAALARAVAAGGGAR